MDHNEVLSYGDFVLTDFDLDLLKRPCYISIQIIGFYFAYLFSLYNSPDILLVSPYVSYMLGERRDESIKDLVESLKLSSKRLVLFAVIDNEHWSLLSYDRSRNAFLHYDSIEGVNHSGAMKLYEAVKEFMGTATQPSIETSSSSAKGKPKKNKKKNGAAKTRGDSGCGVVLASKAAVVPAFEESRTPQQTNGYDCGLYVMAIAKTICQWISGEADDDDSHWVAAIERCVNDSVEMTMRNELLKLIEDLRKGSGKTC